MNWQWNITSAMDRLTSEKRAQWAEALVQAYLRAPNMMFFIKSKYEMNGLKISEYWL